MPTPKTPAKIRPAAKAKESDQFQHLQTQRLALAQAIQSACQNGVLSDGFKELAEMVVAGRLNPGKLSELGARTVCRRMGAKLVPEPSSVASECRKLGLKVGDTIEGTEGTKEPGSWWNTTRLTLLWLGTNEAVFLETHKSSSQPGCSTLRETVNWTLRARDWKKLPV